jgi:hypothetical protein
MYSFLFLASSFYTLKSIKDTLNSILKKDGLFFDYIYLKANNKNLETMKTSNKTTKLNRKDLNLKSKKSNGFDAALMNLGIKLIPNSVEKMDFK